MASPNNPQLVLNPSDQSSVGGNETFGSYFLSNKVPGAGTYSPRGSSVGEMGYQGSVAYTFAPVRTDTRSKTSRCFIDDVKKNAFQPGPGAYSPQSSFGNQVVARNRGGVTAPKFSFSKEDKCSGPDSKKRKPFLSRNHERENIGTHSPAPSYKPAEGARGRPYNKEPSWGFSKSKRF